MRGGVTQLMVDSLITVQLVICYVDGNTDSHLPINRVVAYISVLQVVGIIDHKHRILHHIQVGSIED